jgi:hypothetical protein
MTIRIRQQIVAAAIVLLVFGFQQPAGKWESKFITVAANGTLQYHPDEKGNILPDFSRVGYYQGDQPIPDVPVVKTIRPVRRTVNRLSRMPLMKWPAEHPIKTGSGALSC